MEVKVAIDGKEVELVPRGLYQGFLRFTAPKEIRGLVASVFVRPDWDLIGTEEQRAAEKEEEQC